MFYTLGACHNDDNMRGELEAQLQLFDMAELVWSLCEILFIDTQPGIFFTVVLKVDKTGGGGNLSPTAKSGVLRVEIDYY